MDVEEKQSSAGPQSIRLILQFELESNGMPLQKQVILDLEPDVDDDSTSDVNPIQVVNRTTAAIVQLLSRTVPEREQALEPTLNEEMKFKLKGFTSREMEVFTYLITGVSNTEIAKKLGVSPNTIKFHVKRIFCKLQVTNRVELAAKFGQI